MKPRRRGQPRPVGEVLRTLVKRQGLERDLRQHEIGLRWRELVGERIAGHSTPHRLYQGELTVRVDTPAWLNELTFLKDSLVAEINSRLGDDRVQTIRLVAGSAAPSPDPRIQSPPPRQPFLPSASRDQQQAAQHDARDLLPTVGDAPLDEAICRARAAQLLRQRGVIPSGSEPPND